MPQPKKAPRYGGSPAHHQMIVANLATELFRHGRIKTTLARAKTVQPVADRMVTFAKRGDVHARRQVLRVIRDKDVVHKLFTDVGPAFTSRDGGYTRVLKLGPRKGDAAPMALIELVEGVSGGHEGTLEEAPKRRWSLRRRRGGTLSVSAREREEERAAAVDAGEDLEPAIAPEASGEMAEAVPAGALSSEDEQADVTAQDGGDEEGVQADPAEVEARLAAEEEADEEEADEEAEATEPEDAEPEAAEPEADADEDTDK